MDAGERNAGLDRIRAYLPGLLPALRLQHWRIALLDEACSDDCNADVTWWENKYRADIRLSDGFLTSTPEDQRYSITHELIHLHLRGIALIEKRLAPHVGESVWGVIDDRFEHEEELAVDTLTLIIAPSLPLPPTEEA